MTPQKSKEQEVINKSGNPVLCTDILNESRKLLEENCIVMTEVQWLSFVSHIAGMVYRSTNKETIPAVEKELFNEVSDDSINLASGISEKIGSLQEDEKYLLSIHFETAKQN